MEEDREHTTDEEDVSLRKRSGKETARGGRFQPWGHQGTNRQNRIKYKGSWNTYPKVEARFRKAAIRHQPWKKELALILEEHEARVIIRDVLRKHDIYKDYE